MFKGKRHYNEFFESDEKVSTSVLGDRLRLLEELDIIWKSADNIKKSRIRYSLTEKGIAMLPMMIEIILWSGNFDDKTAADRAFLSKAKKNRPQFLSELTKNLKAEHLSRL